MTTPRVTVPVEPEYTATEYLRLIAEGWEVIEFTGSQMTIQNPEDDGPQELVIDVDAMLSAAPAPEGGGVLDALDEALIYIERLGENIERNDLDMHLDTVERPFSFAQTMRGRFPSLCAALATREEAPVELLSDPQQLEASAAGKLDVLVTMRDHYTFALKGPWPGIATPNYALAGLFKMAGDEIEALRAQPPAPEDAQPVWVDGVPTKHHAKEWFIAETTFGDRVVLTALPEEYAYDFKTADETYIKADRIKRCMPFPDSQYLFPHPAPDVLRVELPDPLLIDAVTKMLDRFDRAKGKGGYPTANERWAVRECVKTLATLQAEQKGGA